MARIVDRRSLSRRGFIQQAALTLAGAGAATALGAGEALAKVSKARARYRDRPRGSERCFVCEHYFAGHCSVVRGRVSAFGWCRFFERGYGG
jgi:hypothetical protein